MNARSPSPIARRILAAIRATAATAATPVRHGWTGLRASPAVLALAAGLMSGCASVGPDYAAPEVELPAGWHAELQPGLAGEQPEPAAWWTRLADPLLDRLVQRATQQGLDVREALARVREARALRGVAGADRFPTLDATAGVERRGESDNTPIGAFVPDNTQYSAGFDASWELDLWGRVRRSIEAADADLAASVEDARDATVSVAAETARTYVELRGFQQRLSIARQNVELQRSTLELAQTRLDAGLVGERDVAQAKTNLQTTVSRVPSLEADRRAAENRLAVLLGAAPGTLAEELAADGAIPVPPAQIAVGVPADLLRRRPDVRRAERVLAAETARIGVAQGDLYPRFTLAGSLGLAADRTGALAQNDSSFFSLGPSLRWTIFDSGRLRQRVQAQDARTDQALLRWERTVLVALEETENALTGFVREQERRGALSEAADQARRAVEFAQTQYREGLTDFQAVVDTERTVAALQDDLAQSETAIASRAVAIYKALGGGWEPQDAVSRADAPAGP